MQIEFKYLKMNIDLINFKLLNIIIITFLFNLGSAQFIVKPDSLFLVTDQANITNLQFKVVKGMTVFNISQYFQISKEQLYELNTDIKNSGLKLGSTLSIPYSQKNLLANLPKPNCNQSAIYYKVRKKESLYKIANIISKIDMDIIIKNNSIKNNEIHEGQILKIGYFNNIQDKTVLNTKSEVSKLSNIREKPISFCKIISAPDKNLFFENLKIKNKLEKTKDIKLKIQTPRNNNLGIANIDHSRERFTFQKIISSDKQESLNCNVISRKVHRDSGIAYWSRNSKAKGVYVLSDNAALNSMIEIFNPLLQRKIFARVIGNIPSNAYDDNIKVVLSPEAALSLGALDERFYVRLNYLK